MSNRVLKNNFTMRAEDLYPLLLLVYGPPPRLGGEHFDSRRDADWKRRNFERAVAHYLKAFVKPNRAKMGMRYCHIIASDFCTWVENQ